MILRSCLLTWLILGENQNAVRSDANRSRGGEGRAILSEPTVGVVRVDFRRDAGLSVRHFVVRLAVDDALERVAVVAAFDRAANAV